MRKLSYVAMGPQESFIVPLLAKEISQMLHYIAGILVVNSQADALKALDCGCGNQPFRDRIVEKGFRYESLDVCQNSFNSVDYILAIDCPPSEFQAAVGNKYSLVLATEVLEHVSNWQYALANIASCMEPGGYALLTAPFFYPLHEEPHDYCRPTLHMFERASRSAGLDLHLAKKLGSAVDVIGTTLGAARITYSPTGARRIFGKIINRVLLKSQEIAFSMLLHNREHLETDCETLYLSNVIVLRKPSSC